MKPYKKITIESTELTKEEIEENKLFNVFVFSLPRSGSSMMTSIVEALGVNVIYTSDSDENLEKRNEKERERYGDSYQMNPLGFYEITEDVWDHYFEIMSKPFSGCKMIIPISRDRLSVVTFNPNAKIIQMWRDPEEMRQSQQASYNGNAGITPEEAEHARALIRTKLVNSKLQLENLGLDALHIQYRDVLDDTESQVRKVANFLGVTDEVAIERGIAKVKPNQNRFKKEDLIENI